METSLKV